LHKPYPTILHTFLLQTMTERRDKSEASVPRKRALVSCDRCKLRRARCIRVSPNEPCTDCKISGVQCESKLPRKQRVYGSVETLSLRYRALESLVKGLFPKENVQDLNTIFRIAAARNISMPANDDYTRADIFNDSNEPAQQQQYHSVQESSMRTQPPPRQSLPAVYQPTSSVGNASSESSTRQSQRNPFSQVQERSQQTNELIPTRHGTSHYFGPSSSFRLAITIRGLVARCKAAGGVDFHMPPSSNSPDSGPTSRASSSLRPASANPSDEEYMIPDPRRRQSPNSRIGQKRSRSQMEGTEDRWMEHGSSPLTIGDLLPSRPLSDALVSAYFDHVHIFLPLFHRSMFHLRLEAMYSRQAEALKNTKDMGWLICLAMVFFFGCQQLNEHDPEQAQKLQLKYLSFAKTYFPKLLVNTSLANVQALTLLNAHHHIIGQKSKLHTYEFHVGYTLTWHLQIYRHFMAAHWTWGSHGS
jgi:proline utilization trans-activator